jgi:hypothetical protein
MAQEIPPKKRISKQLSGDPSNDLDYPIVSRSSAEADHNSVLN